MEQECGNAAQSTWLQSKLSDLEENTKSMISLIKLENGGSFAKRAEMYYENKPELEKRIAKYQQLYRLLLDHCTPILNRSSISSIPAVNNFGNNSFRIFPNSLKIESRVDNVDSETNERNRSTFKMCEKNVSETNETSLKKTNEDIFDRLVDFEKRISFSEELLKDNERHVDELTRRYEEKNEANKKLREQIEVLMKEIELLQNDNLILLSEKRSLNSVIVDRIKDIKNSIKKFKGLIKSSYSRRK